MFIEHHDTYASFGDTCPQATLETVRKNTEQYHQKIQNINLHSCVEWTLLVMIVSEKHSIISNVVKRLSTTFMILVCTLFLSQIYCNFIYLAMHCPDTLGKRISTMNSLPRTRWMLWKNHRIGHNFPREHTVMGVRLQLDLPSYQNLPARPTSFSFTQYLLVLSCGSPHCIHLVKPFQSQELCLTEESFLLCYGSLKPSKNPGASKIVPKITVLQKRKKVAVTNCNLKTYILRWWMQSELTMVYKI